MLRYTLCLARLMFILIVCGTGRMLFAAELMSPPAAAKPLLAYIGTYAEESEEGILVYQLDVATAALTKVGGVRGIKNPSFQTIHPNKKFLYSVSESQDFQGRRSGSVSALAIDQQTGLLTILNVQPSHGAAPCHLLTDHQGRALVVANYTSGSLAVLPIQRDGQLDIPHNLVQHTGSSVHPSRQKTPHAHCVNNDAHDRFVVSADLGTDKVMIYQFDVAGYALQPNAQMPFVQVKPGSGPRHFGFHTNGKFGYVINELSSTVTAFQFDGQAGTLQEIQTVSTLPADFRGDNTTAEVFVSPDGRFLYGSNRGHNSIVVYRIDQATGRLTYVSHHGTKGEQPRNFGITPDGQLLLAANQRTGNVVVFRIDSQRGTLTDTGTVIEVPSPVCVTFLQL